MTPKSWDEGIILIPDLKLRSLFYFYQRYLIIKVSYDILNITHFKNEETILCSFGTMITGAG